MQKTLDQTMSDNAQLLIIEAGHAERHYWKDLWRYRELLYFLALRDLSVRYKQTFFGVAWAVMRPLLTMLVFTTVFGRLAGLPSGAAPYSVMVFIGMLAWQLFSSVLVDSGNSIVNNGGMISKVYFPRLVIPLSTVIVSLTDFLISAAILAVLMGWHGLVPGRQILALPLFIVLGLALAIGAGLWIAALNVKYRDFRFVVSFSIQLGLYISPVGFSSAVVPDEWRLLYSANPMVGVVDGFRWALLGEGMPLYWPSVWLSMFVAAALLASSILYFRKTEKSFADDI